MNCFKKIFALLLVLCLAFCIMGCEEEYDAYDNFEPSGVLIVDCLSGNQYKTNIDDADFAKSMFDEFEKLNIDTATEGEMGSSYLYMRFYNEKQDTFLIFTIYDNGSCCLGEEYYDFYTVTDGRQAYVDLCEFYESYDAE